MVNKAKETLAPSAARFLKSKTKDSRILSLITLKLTLKILINGWYLGLILFLYLWLMTCRTLRNAKEGKGTKETMVALSL